MSEAAPKTPTMSPYHQVRSSEMPLDPTPPLRQKNDGSICVSCWDGTRTDHSTRHPRVKPEDDR